MTVYNFLQLAIMIIVRIFNKWMTMMVDNIDDNDVRLIMIFLNNTIIIIILLKDTFVIYCSTVVKIKIKQFS